MNKYKVKLEYIYSDVVYVEAKNEEDARKEAMNHSEEEYDRFYDFTVSLEDEEKENN